MKVTDILSETQRSNEKALKKINALNDEIELAKEKGKKPDRAAVAELAKRVKEFERATGMSFVDYEAMRNVSSRDINGMLDRIKTTDLRPGDSQTLIAKEAPRGALLNHILRDIAGQFDDDITNVLSSYLTADRNNRKPNKDEIKVATAAAQRILDLGLQNAYQSKRVGKLEKHSRTYDYDKENPSEYQDEY